MDAANSTQMKPFQERRSAKFAKIFPHFKAKHLFQSKRSAPPKEEGEVRRSSVISNASETQTMYVPTLEKRIVEQEEEVSIVSRIHDTYASSDDDDFYISSSIQKRSSVEKLSKLMDLIETERKLWV